MLRACALKVSGEKDEKIATSVFYGKLK